MEDKIEIRSPILFKYETRVIDGWIDEYNIKTIHPEIKVEFGKQMNSYEWQYSNHYVLAYHLIFRDLEETKGVWSRLWG